jgi:hypothetical protein
MYLISVQFTNILLDFMALQRADWIYTLSLSLVACATNEGGTGSEIAVVSGEIATVIWCMSFTAETLAFLYQYFV